jgi:hypothetical protein
MYGKAESNVTKLKRMGAMVLHGVDVKDMKRHIDLKFKRFDRIVFNFPHAGHRKREPGAYDHVRLLSFDAVIFFPLFVDLLALTRE